MQDYSLFFTPMTKRLNLGNEKDSSQVDSKHFQKLVGMHIYLINTKPEIFFTMRVLNRFMYNPCIPYLQAKNQVLRYIKGILRLKIFYERCHSSTFLGFTNSNWANCKINKKSIIRWIFKLVRRSIL